jgi:hypothetical protein
MTRGEHPKKAIRDALAAVAETHVEVVPKPGSHGHAWGYLRCRVCGERKFVWSTPKSAENHAKDLIRWTARHTHEER